MSSSLAVSGFALNACVCARVWRLPVSLNVCVSIISPRRDPVDCRSCPVVVTVPGAASGTIWPPWKSSAGATSEQACKRERDEDYCGTDSAKQHRWFSLHPVGGVKGVNQCQILDQFKGFAHKMRIIRVFLKSRNLYLIVFLSKTQ